MSKLVEKLCMGDHPLEVRLWSDANCSALRDSVSSGYVHIRFTDTAGGTELGVTLDKSLTRLDGADFVAGEGMIMLVGNLALDYVPLRCWAHIDLSSLTGTGHLECV